MKNLTLIIAIMGICAFIVNAQNMFTARRLTFEPAQEGFAAWSSDGKYIIFPHTNMKDTIGKNGLWKILPDGTEEKQVFKGIAEHPKVSPDGRYIVFDADTGKSIKMIPAEGGDPVIFLPDTIHIENGGLPCWSPDASQLRLRVPDIHCVHNT